MHKTVKKKGIKGETVKIKTKVFLLQHGVGTYETNLEKLSCRLACIYLRINRRCGAI